MRIYAIDTTTPTPNIQDASHHATGKYLLFYDSKI